MPAQLQAVVRSVVDLILVHVEIIEMSRTCVLLAISIGYMAQSAYPLAASNIVTWVMSLIKKLVVGYCGCDWQGLNRVK